LASRDLGVNGDWTKTDLMMGEMTSSMKIRNDNKVPRSDTNSGLQYNQWWYSCHAGVVLYLFDFALFNGQGENRK
jgi:hypothetical protein